LTGRTRRPVGFTLREISVKPVAFIHSPVHMEITGLRPNNFHIPVIAYIHDRYSRVITKRENPAKALAQRTVHNKIKCLLAGRFPRARVKAATVKLRQK
jgi:hypothetical protein